MKISNWLLGHYKKKFGNDLIVLDHSTGPTWNDGGAWNYTIVKVGDKTLGIKMDSDYRSDDLDVIELKPVNTIKYVPK